MREDRGEGVLVVRGESAEGELLVRGGRGVWVVEMEDEELEWRSCMHELAGCDELGSEKLAVVEIELFGTKGRKSCLTGLETFPTGFVPGCTGTDDSLPVFRLFCCCCCCCFSSMGGTEGTVLLRVGPVWESHVNIM